MTEQKIVKIAICDDEVEMASDIEERILNLQEKYSVRVEIDVFYDGSTLTEYIAKNDNYDLIYLDIEMENEDGVAAARKIRMFNKSVLIIFVTSHESFAKEVFEVSAFRFITKPINDEIFNRYFIDAINEFTAKPRYFYYQYKKVPYRIPLNDIFYFQSDKRVTYIMVKDDYKKCYLKLNHIEKKLDEMLYSFIRIHQSFLVNPRYIEVYTYNSVTLTDGTVLNISEKRKKEASEQYLKYKGNQLGI